MIKTFDSYLGQSVYMTELYDYLELTPTYYSRWVEKELLNNVYLSESKDYCSAVQVSKSAGRFRKDYFVHIDTAKKLCMVSKSAKGNQIRDELVRLTKQVENKDLLDENQIIMLSGLIGIFKYITNQTTALNIHKDKFVSESNSKSPYIEFHTWRNRILNIEPKIIEQKIKQYCIDNKRNLANIPTSKNDQILLLNAYDSLRNAIWDFLNIKGEFNSLKLANLCSKMAKAQNIDFYRSNENSLFQKKKIFYHYQNLKNSNNNERKSNKKRGVL